MSLRLKEIAAELSQYPCASFPHLVCEETVGLKYDDWCGICQSKLFIKLYNEKESAARDQTLEEIASSQILFG